MARVKKPSGKERKHRVWIPDDGFGGLKYTKGHGMMRIDGYPNGTFEYRYVFCFNEWGCYDGVYKFFWDDGIRGENKFSDIESLLKALKASGPNPYERLDGGDIDESFGLAKMWAPSYVKAWIEVDEYHKWAVPTDIT